MAISAILHAILDSPAQREEEKASPKSSKAHNAGGAKEEDSGSKRGEGSGMTEAEAKEAEEARELSEEEEEMAQTAIGRVGVSFFQSAVSCAPHHNSRGPPWIHPDASGCAAPHRRALLLRRSRSVSAHGFFSHHTPAASTCARFCPVNRVCTFFGAQVHVRSYCAPSHAISFQPHLRRVGQGCVLLPHPGENTKLVPRSPTVPAHCTECS